MLCQDNPLATLGNYKARQKAGLVYIGKVSA
jgi:hypothetical protein